MRSTSRAAARYRRIASPVLAASLCTSAWAVPAYASTATSTEKHTTASTASAAPAIRALAEAKDSGKSVTIDTLTTASSQTSANPDGTFTLDETAMPTRTHTAHGWVNLDATLHRNPDGTLSPAATTSPLVLSGGGTAALARMSVARRTMAVSFPATLPAPTLSGATRPIATFCRRSTWS